jgi:hypothetical protein
LETQTAPIPEKALEIQATRYRQRLYNNKKSKVGGSLKKKKKAARKEQEKKVAKEAEGATKTYDEAVVLLADVILKGKRIAESWSPRKDQDDGIKELQKRLVADVERFDNSTFDILGDAAMSRLAPILIALSGKKKDKRNRMSVLSAMHHAPKVQRAAEGRPGHEAHLQAPGRCGHLDSLHEFVWP